MTTESLHRDTIFNILLYAARARSRDLLNALTAQHGFSVQSGPFAGMALIGRPGWSESDAQPMLLGVFESELHSLLEEGVAERPDVVVNIGSADGYYAVGLARRLPDARVHAFDSSETAGANCREAARLNGVDARVEVHGAGDGAALRRVLAGA